MELSGTLQLSGLLVLFDLAALTREDVASLKVIIQVDLSIKRDYGLVVGNMGV